LRLATGGETLRVGNLAQQLFAAFEILLPGFGEFVTARGAAQQSDTEALFEKTHVFAHHRWREAQRARSGRKAAAFNSSDEYFHALQPIHECKLPVSTVRNSRGFFPRQKARRLQA
jgi:hypothetical protein